MTREEAIELLSAYGVPLNEERFQEALDMAISALSAEEADGCLGCEYEGLSEFDEPCTDCKNNYLNKWTTKKTEPSDLISRAKVLNVVQNADDGNIPYEIIKDIIQGLPSVSAERISRA